MRGRRPGLALAVLCAGAAVLAALVVVEATRSAGEPSRAGYLAAVETICQRYDERLDRIPPPGDLSSPGSVVESLRQALPVLREQEREVRGLAAPVELRRQLARFFTFTDRSLAALGEALDAALERALYPMATALTRFGEQRDEAKRVAREIGFQC